MNYQSNNGITTINSHDKKVTIINGVEYPWVKGMRGFSTTTVNNKVFIDGYELTKNGEWKRTLRALWHLIF